MEAKISEESEEGGGTEPESASVQEISESAFSYILLMVLFKV